MPVITALRDTSNSAKVQSSSSRVSPVARTLSAPACQAKQRLAQLITGQGKAGTIWQRGEEIVPPETQGEGDLLTGAQKTSQHTRGPQTPHVWSGESSLAEPCGKPFVAH